MRKIYLAALASVCMLAAMNPARADLGEAIGDYVIKKYNPKKTYIIGGKDMFGTGFSGGLANTLKERGLEYGMERVNTPAQDEDIKYIIDSYMTPSGPYDLLYCALDTDSCEVMSGYLKEKGYGGKMLNMFLDEIE